jgi:hypothetical protein
LRTTKPETKNNGSYLEPQKTTGNCNIQAAEHMFNATVHITKKKKMRYVSSPHGYSMYLVTLSGKKKTNQYKIMSAESANNVKSENKAHNKANDNKSTLSKIKIKKIKKTEK